MRYLLLSLLALLTAQASTITWGTPTTISGSSDVSSNGTSVGAVNLNGSSTTVNGTTFTGVTLPAGPTTSTSGNFTIGVPSFTNGANTSSTNALFTVLPTNYASLVGTGVSLVNTLTVTLNSLTVGQSYEFQVWSNSGQNFTYFLTVADGASTADISGGSIGNQFNPDTLGQFVIGTFVADATSKSISLSPNEAGYVNGFQLRAIQTNSAVPEPASTALIALGLGALAFARKRR